MTIAAGPRVSSTGLTLSLDPGNTRSYPGSGTTFTDLSGLANHATLSTSAPTYSSDQGGYLSFNGTSNYGYIPYTASLAPTSAESACVWAYVADWANTTASVRFVSKTEGGGFNLGLNDTGATINYSRHLSGSYRVATYSRSSISGGWHYIVGTCDGRYTKLYLDGVLVSTVDAGSSGSLTYAVNNNFVIAAEAAGGATNSITGSFLAGRLGAIQMYNVALTDVQIENNFNATRSRYGI